MYQVIIKNQGHVFYLRGTTWAFTAERGRVFETIEEAAQASLAARPFTRPSLFKKATIIAAGSID